VLIRAVHPVASVCILAHDLWVKIHTFVAVSALREEFALFGWVVVRTLALCLFAVREVPASNRFQVLSLLGLAGLLLRLALFALVLVQLLLLQVCAGVAGAVLRNLVRGVHGPEALQTLLLQLLSLVLAHHRLLEVQLLRLLRRSEFIKSLIAAIIRLIMLITLFVRYRVFLVPVSTN